MSWPPLSPDFSGIDGTRVVCGEFVGSLTRGHDVIRQETDAVRRISTSVNVSSAGLNPIGEVLARLETELPQLRRCQAAITRRMGGIRR